MKEIATSPKTCQRVSWNTVHSLDLPGDLMVKALRHCHWQSIRTSESLIEITIVISLLSIFLNGTFLRVYCSLFDCFTHGSVSQCQVPASSGHTAGTLPKGNPFSLNLDILYCWQSAVPTCTISIDQMNIPKGSQGRLMAGSRIQNIRVTSGTRRRVL
jgi:hypothetical protein